MSVKVDFSTFDEQTKAFLVQSFLSKRAREAARNIRPKLGRALKKLWEKTTLAQGLRGKFAFDLERDAQAILGVEDGDLAVEAIGDALAEAVTFAGFRTTPNAVFFFLKTENLREYLTTNVDEDLQSYVSENGFTIQWLEWLLSGQSDVAGQIIFAVDGKERVASYSRTGRAIMSTRFSDTFDISTYNFSETGETFLDDLINDPTLVDTAAKLLGNELRRV